LSGWMLMVEREDTAMELNWKHLVVIYFTN